MPKRVNFVLPESTHSELEALAKSHGRTMTELVKLGLALAKTALDAKRDGDCLIVASSDEYKNFKPIRQILVV